MQEASIYKNEFEKGLLYNDTVQELATALNDYSTLAWAHRSRGHIYLIQGKYVEAYEELINGLEINRKAANPEAGASLQLTLADVLANLREYEQVDSLYRTAINHFRASGDFDRGVIFGLLHYGISLQKQGKEFKALEAFREGHALALKKGDTEGVFAASLNLGWAYASVGQADSAAYYCGRGLESATRKKDLYAKAHCYKCIGYNKMKQGKLAEAEPDLLSASELYNRMGMMEEKKDLFSYLSLLYERQGAHEEALRYHQQFKAVSDSIFNLQKSRQLALLQTQYRIAEKERINAQLQEELELQNQLSRLYGVLGLLALGLLVAAYYLYRSKSRNNLRLEREVAQRTAALSASNQNLQYANQQLREFSYITSHDMKEPIRNINRFATLVSRRLSNGDTEGLDEFMGYISKGALQLDNLVKDVYSFTRLDEINLRYTTFRLSEVMEAVEADLLVVKAEKAAVLTYEDQRLCIPYEALRVILKNLVENAWKYNEQDVARVEVNCTETLTHYSFRVADNGIGIPEEYRDYVFNMFKRLHSRDKYSGSGLGLSIVKRVVQKIKGEIHLESPGIGNTGTVVAFSIPKKQAPAEEQLA